MARQAPFWGVDKAPFIIAEMSGNHNQSLDYAFKIVDAAAQAGAHAIKLQTFTEDSMTLDLPGDDFQVTDPKSLWAGQSLYELYGKAKLPMEWHQPIMERATAKGMLCFSSPFDEAAVDFLENLNVPAYKIASFECIDLPLIAKAASTRKPVIISTGMATVAEIAEAVDTARSAGCKDLVILKCTSTYPATAENSNLRTLPQMRDTFACEVGLSDHTAGIGAAVASVVLGAVVIEKHFTLSREDGGIDAAFSLEPPELKSLVNESHTAWQALGEARIGPAQVEMAARQRRRSIYVCKDMQAGEAFTPQNIRRIRPGKGMEPKYYDMVLGRKAKAAIKKGTPLSWNLF